jgi:hypothetical protein
MNGEIWGYDPGGDGNHGVAKIILRKAQVTNLSCETCTTANEAFSWFGDKTPLGFGVDTLTEWNTDKCGWRSADKLLRNHYPKASNSVMAPNALRGSMVINGMALVLAIRKKWPDIIVSETHPKILYCELSKRLYGDDDLQRKNQAIMKLLGVRTNQQMPKDDNQWDALASTFSVWSGIFGSWRADLHAHSLDSNSVICPAGKTVFFWPRNLT